MNDVSNLIERLRQIAESQRMDFDSPNVAATLDDAATTLEALATIHYGDDPVCGCWGEQHDHTDRENCDHDSYYVNDDGAQVCLVCGHTTDREDRTP